jgi:putative phage-type endonuclease
MLDLEARKKGIGGSDVAAICGISPWKSAYEVWLDKTSPVGSENPPSAAMEYGIMMEPVIRRWYEKKTGRRVRVNGMMYQHHEHHFMLANLDGIMDDRILEIKTARSSQDWGEPGSDEIPAYYRTQVEHYLMVTGLPMADVVVSFAGSIPMIYEVEADLELQAALLEQEKEFWLSVLTNTPPLPVTLSDMMKAFPRSLAKSITASADLEATITMLRNIQGRIKAFAQMEEELKTQLMGEMGEAEAILSLSGKPLVTWKSAKATKLLDQAILKSLHPEVYEECLREGKSQRRFLVKKGVINE